MSASTGRQLSQPKLNIAIPDTNQTPITTGARKQNAAKRQESADFSQLPKELTLIDKLGLSTPSQYQRGQLRASTTPNQISISSIITLLSECSRGIRNLNHHIPGLERLSRQIKEVQDTLVCREGDVEKFLDTPIEQGRAPPKTPGTAARDSSPVIQHPYKRPSNWFEGSDEKITLMHWVYDLQKNAWIFNEKTLRYENIITTILSQSQRKRKLFDLGLDVHTSWVNLMLHLGLVIAQQNNAAQIQTSTNLNKLVVATGMAESILELQDPYDLKALFIQGEKYLLGYGVTQSYETAFKRYQAAAKQGSAEASNMLGVLYEFGIGTKKDLANAVKCYTFAATQGNPDSLNNLGRLNETGKGCELSLKNALSLYKKAAAKGHTDAMTNYGYLLENGMGVPENKKTAIEYYTMAADKGYARAQNALGTCYYKGSGTKRDFYQACVYYRKAADHGYAPAQNNLGICYEEGHGLPQDMARAKAYYKLASDKKHAGATNNLGYVLLMEHEYLEAIEKFYLAKSLGSTDAIFHLGHLYELGCRDKDGVVLQPDILMALRFYAEAGKKGHTKSLLRLASILICGPSNVVDVQRAVMALKTVAESTSTSGKGIRFEESLSKNISDAQNMLGELCELGMHEGIAGIPDLNLALEWYRKALKNGHDRAMYNLAAMYEKGDIISRNMEKAIRLYEEAEKKGNKDATKRLKDLSELGLRVAEE